MKSYRKFIRKRLVQKRELWKISFLMSMLLLMTSAALAQITVSGKVVDGKSEPLIGVSVVVKGSTTGIMTDIDGQYSINVPNSNSVLVFSFVGFETQEVTVKNNTTINVTLFEDAQILDEVVVVGYTTVRRQSLTGALQTVNEEKLRDQTTPNVETMLASKAPGIQVTPAAEPGESGQITMRGKSTLSGSLDPLWVVDGVIIGSNSSSINPMDIENITILKDAASTAVYGSQGANGVILVTTKKGKSGKPTINLSTKWTASNLTMGNWKVMDGAELYDYYDSMKGRPESATWFTPDLRNRNFDWKDEATRTGLIQDYNLSISGGNDNLRTYISLGYYDEEGAVKGYDFTRYNFLFKTEYSPYKWLTIKPMIQGSRSDRDIQTIGVSSAYSILPWNSPYNDDGSIKDARPSDWILVSSMGNPLWDNQWNFKETRDYVFTGNFDFDIKITDWLTFASINSYRYGNTSVTEYIDPRSEEGEASKGSVREENSSWDRQYTNQLLRFNKTFDKHYLNGVIGYEWNEYNGKSAKSTAAGIPAGFIVQDVATTPKEAYSLRDGWAVESLLSNFNYSYDDRYMGQVSVRRDGASNFGINNKWGTFFSVGAGWTISNEKFFNLNFINNLKLRGSYGSVGNRPKEMYPWQGLYAIKIKNSYNSTTGAMRNQLPNHDLNWEKAYVTGFGLDVGFWNRVNLTVDYYYKNTSDLLFLVPIPSVIGVGGIFRNSGRLVNQGVEISIGAELFRNKDWMWRVDGNITYNKNRLKELNGTQTQRIVSDESEIYGGAEYIQKIGKDMDTYYMPKWAGVNPKNGEPMWYTFDENGNESGTTSDYAVAQRNRTEVGKASPDWFGGFSTSLIYKNFDLSANFGFSIGGRIYNYNRSTMDSDGAYLYFNQIKLGHGWSRWQKEGDIATHPEAIWGNSSKSNQISSRYLESATFLKMRNLTVGYNVPLNSLRQYISNVKVFFSADNLFTITPYSGIDPELPGKRDRTAVSQYPQSRKFSFGINISL